MSLAVLASQALHGLDASAVRVEVHVGSGLPAFHIVGLPDTGVRESRERVRSAIVSSGFEFPAARITANLAPADLPKESGRFDLPIALGILLASGQVAIENTDGKKTAKAPELGHYVLAGELSLTGALVSISAPLAIALAVVRQHPERVLILPEANAPLAARVPGLTVLSARSLEEVVQYFRGELRLEQATPLPTSTKPPAAACMSEVRGQAQAKRALEVAAAGGHSLLMSGPPGIGKSMLAHRFPSILPLLNDSQSLEVAAVKSLCGQVPDISHLPPFRAPHHSASRPALIGGGSVPTPGEISLAHHGVLFLDELPEFNRQTLEALREPIETGYVTIARATRTLSFPSRFQLIAAMNPCPCGWLGHQQRHCSCSPERVAAYRAKLSGPLLDRIDLHITLTSSESDWLTSQPETRSEDIRSRVQACRERQIQRQGFPNANLGITDIKHHCQLDSPAQEVLLKASRRWNWSTRAIHRILRTARTIADLESASAISAANIAEAVQYRPS